MCDCVPSTFPFYTVIRTRKLGFTGHDWEPRTVPIRRIVNRHSPVPNLRSSDGAGFTKSGESQLFSGGIVISNGAQTNTTKSKIFIKATRNSSSLGSDEYGFHGEFGFKKKDKTQIQFARDGEKQTENSINRNGIDSGNRTNENSQSNDAPDSSGVDFLEFGDKSEKKKLRQFKDDDMFRMEGCDGVNTKLEELGRENVGPVLRSGKHMMRRSNMIAKQVISMQSALSLGFVSQLWVDTNSWVVLVVEVRPNLLSGEIERLFLENISKVGDVVLIKDESMMENVFKMVGLETLVGYNVVTAGRRNIGKVRGYTFNMNSGAIELLELDSFGISIIPSSMVSTYALFVEDVLEVVADMVVVHEAAASHMQRLTKGFWDAQPIKHPIDEVGEYSDLETQPTQDDYGRSRRRSFTGRKFRQKIGENPVDNWDLPMDYL